MTLNHDQARDLISRQVYGEPIEETAGDLDRHLATCDACARWKEEMASLIGDLSTLRTEGSAELDAALSSTLHRGLPEDPWSILWEVAGEGTDLDHSRFFRMPPWSDDARRKREAAELETPERVPSLEQLVRARSIRVEEIVGSTDSRVVIAEFAHGIWVGVLTSAERVPLTGVRVRWSDGGHGEHSCVTDLRGSFRISDPTRSTQRLLMGPPVNAEVVLT